jgi:hypothetical protein
MPLFTFVAEYKGGTYVSQVKAANLKVALRTWARELEPDVITGFGKAGHKRIIDECEVEVLPVALNEVKNVWFFYVRGFFVNVVNTSQN